MTASPVTVQDPNTPANQLTVNGLGQIGISNFPPTQSIIGSVYVTNFPSNQTISGLIDVSDRVGRLVGHVTVDSLPGGTTGTPFYNVLQDPVTPANKLKVNSDGSINISGSISATNPSVGSTGSAVPASGTYLAANKSGNLVGMTLDSSNNLNVNVQTGTITVSNPSVGTDGSALPTSSTLIGASDGTNLQQLLVESSSNRNLRVGIYSGANEVTVTGANALKVDNSGVTQPVSGTITANVGTTNGLALDASVGKLNVAQSTALGSNTGPMVQGSVTTGAPTYTTGQINPLSLTTAGALRTDASATTQPVSGTFWQTTQPISGTVTANQGGSNWSQNLAQVGGSSFALGQQLGNASLPIVLTASQLTTLTPLASVTANIGTTNGLALDSSVNGVLVAQGSTTSGEKGPLIQGAVTTSAPSYTTAQTSPLSLTTAGAVRVDGSAVTQPVSGTFWQATQPISAASLPLPSGASTSAKQPALGTAGSASADVLSVQGIASMTALKVDGSAVTQPVSGTITANQGGTWTVQPGNTANTTPWLATINQGGNSATVTGSNALKVDNSAVTQPVSGTVTANAGTGTFNVQNLSVVSASNSSTSTLTANSVFTGTGESTLGFTGVSVEVYADQASAAGGLSVQQSQDNSHWDIADTFTILASTGFQTTVNFVGQYYRIVYTNGGTGQSTFRLQTIKQVGNQPLARTLTASGNLKVAVQEALPAGANTIGAINQAGTWNITNVSGTVSLPTGAATSAKQPALGTAGSASSDVISVQGIASMTALKVDGSGVTQPIKGNFTEQASLSANALNAYLVPVTDVSAYKFFSLQIEGTWNATLTVYGGNDSSNLKAIDVISLSGFGGYYAGGNGIFNNGAANILIGRDVSFRYLAVQVTNYSSGTVTGVLELYAISPPYATTWAQSQQSFGWSVQIEGLNPSGNSENWKSNQDNITLVASAAYTTTQTSADQTNVNGRGVIVVLDMTNVASSPSVTLTIQGKDPLSGKYFTLLAGAAVTTASTNVYYVYPGVPVTANASASYPLPRTWRVNVVANNSNSGTYSVGASTIL